MGKQITGRLRFDRSFPDESSEVGSRVHNRSNGRFEFGLRLRRGHDANQKTMVSNLVGRIDGGRLLVGPAL